VVYAPGAGLKPGGATVKEYAELAIALSFHPASYAMAFRFCEMPTITGLV